MCEEKTVVVKSMFLTPSVERDQPVLIGDTTIYVSRELLSMHSNVFKKLFFADGASRKKSDASESSENSTLTAVVVLPLSVDPPEISVDDFLLLLENLCSYPTRSPIDETNYAALLNLATKFDIKQVEEDCKRYIHKEINDLKVVDEKCIELAVAACRNHCASVLIRLIPFVASFKYDKLKSVSEKLPLIAMKAIYEAKMNRMSNILAIRHKFVHQCGKCSDCKIESSQKCETCGWWCQNCSKKYGCVKDFHAAGCHKNHKKCLCGYNFDESQVREKL